MSIPLPLIAASRIHSAAVASVSPFGTPDGVTSAFQLADKYGFPIRANAAVTAMHRTDWQGRQLLYATARTNNTPYSNDLTQIAPSAWAKIGPLVVTHAATGGPDGGDCSTLSGAIGGAAGGSVYSYIASGFTALATAFYMRLSAASAGVLNVENPSNYIDGQWLVALTGMPTGVWLRIDPSSPYVTVKFPFQTSTGIFFFNTNNVTVLPNFDVAYCFQVAGSNIGALFETAASVVTVTDYTYTPSGVATMGQIPVASAALDWDGSGLSVG